MPAAGEKIRVGRIPGELVGRQIETADSAGFTSTETVLITLTVPVIDARIYDVEGKLRVQSAAASINEGCQLRLREDSVTGNELDRVLVTIATTAGTVGYGANLFAQYTSDATEDKTFVITGVKIAAATGAQRMEASGATPGILSVRFTED